MVKVDVNKIKHQRFRDKESTNYLQQSQTLKI
jgi:hypothetical protein